jgi:hypothetical protein
MLNRGKKIKSEKYHYNTLPTGLAVSGLWQFQQQFHKKNFLDKKNYRIIFQNIFFLIFGVGSFRAF